MRAWRICRYAYADLTGGAARLWGGRWNSPGRPLVYAADSAALAVLEVRVHLDLSFDLLPADYVLLTLDLGTLSIETVPSLPPTRPRLAMLGWRQGAPRFSKCRRSSCRRA